MGDPDVVGAASDGHSAKTWLQHTAEVIRNRDWFGIAIEIGVVTLGVLIAFQIDQWGQDRRQARDERQFLERMWRETAEAIKENEWAMTMHARFRREFIDGLNSADDPRAVARLAATPNVGCRSTVFPALAFNNTSFQELSNSGRLNAISDPDLREQLREVVSAQADAEEQRSNSLAFAMEAYRTLLPYYVPGLDRDGNRTCRMDWPRLVQDKQARFALARSARLHALVWTRRAYTRDALAAAHNRIACILNKPDCRDRVAQVFRVRPRWDVIPPEALDDVERSSAMYNGT